MAAEPIVEPGGFETAVQRRRQPQGEQQQSNERAETSHDATQSLGRTKSRAARVDSDRPRAAVSPFKTVRMWQAGGRDDVRSSRHRKTPTLIQSSMKTTSLSA